MSSPVPIDPALQAEEASYRSSLPGIYPSRPNESGSGLGHLQASSSSGIERSDREVGTPDTTNGGGGGGKKRIKGDDDDTKQKKSRQSRKSI